MMRRTIVAVAVVLVAGCAATDEEASTVTQRIADDTTDAVASLREQIRDVAEAPAAEPGSTEELLQGLAEIVDGGVDGLSEEFERLGELARDVADELATDPAVPADGADVGPPSADAPAPSTTTDRTGATSSSCRAGAAPVGDVDAAVEVLTLLDDGTPVGAARWEQDLVTVSIVGNAVEQADLRLVDEVLAALSAATGLEYAVRDGDADLVVDLSAGNAPRAVISVRGSTIVAAEASWDPTLWHACRWAYEELGHTAGPVGDFGPVGSVWSTDQSASSFSPFDLWVLEALYAADSPGTVAEALGASVS